MNASDPDGTPARLPRWGPHPAAAASHGATDAASPPTARLAKSAGIIGLATMTSRILGLIRDQVLAYLFGAGHAMDAFNVAFRIPNLLRDLFAEGAMSAAFVPAFTRRLALGGQTNAWYLGNQLVNALVVVTGTLVLAGIVFAEPLTRALAGDYDQVPGKLDLTVRLTRIMLPFLTLVALAAAFMGMLNSLHRFFTPALSPAMFNVGMIGCALALVPIMPRLGLDPIVAIAIGVIIGGLGQAGLQLPALYRHGYRYRPVLHPTDPGLLEILHLMGPGTLAGAAAQINLFVNTVLATGQGEGAVSWLNYAFRLMYVPIGLFGVSIATAALPTFSRHAAREEMAGVRDTLSSGLRMMLMLNVPATAGLIVLASPIVEVIFQRGSFTAADTARTAAALTFYAPGLLGYSAVRIAVPCFYALGNSRTPMLVSLATVVVNVGLNLALVRTMGYRGLALGTGLAALFNATVLLSLLRVRLNGLDGRRIGRALAKIAVASLVMAGAAAASHGWLLSVAPADGLLSGLLRLGGSIGTALVTLIVAAKVLRIEEFDDARVRLVRKLRVVR
jgi:putative peptidoglycan lipid II flippase